MKALCVGIVGVLLLICGLHYNGIPLLPGMPIHYDGQWVVTTTALQFCWLIGSDGESVVETGWHKMPGRNVWYRGVGVEVLDMTFEEILEQQRAIGAVAYPGETPAETRARRDRAREWKAAWAEGE